MTSPKAAYLVAAIAAIQSALTAEGVSGATGRVVIEPVEGQAFPYVVVDAGTVTPWSTKTSEGAEMTATFVTWSTGYDQCLSLSSAVMDSLTDRDSVLSPTGWTMGPHDVDAEGPLLRERRDRTTIFGMPVRMRVKLEKA